MKVSAFEVKAQCCPLIKNRVERFHGKVGLESFPTVYDTSILGVSELFIYHWKPRKLSFLWISKH